MIFITAKFRIKPDDADHWPEIVREFTEATRSEPGCLWFDWARRVDDPNEYMLVEAFRDDEAAGAHVRSAHFREAQKNGPWPSSGNPTHYQCEHSPERLVAAH